MKESNFHRSDQNRLHCHYANPQLVATIGLEPIRLSTTDFKSAGSTDSPTWPLYINWWAVWGTIPASREASDLQSEPSP